MKKIMSNQINGEYRSGLLCNSSKFDVWLTGIFYLFLNYYLQSKKIKIVNLTILLFQFYGVKRKINYEQTLFLFRLTKNNEKPTPHIHDSHVSKIISCSSWQCYIILTNRADPWDDLYNSSCIILMHVQIDQINYLNQPNKIKLRRKSVLTFRWYDSVSYTVFGVYRLHKHYSRPREWAREECSLPVRIRVRDCLK